jgi:hypothetical protein
MALWVGLIDCLLGQLGSSLKGRCHVPTYTPFLGSFLMHHDRKDVSLQYKPSPDRVISRMGWWVWRISSLPYETSSTGIGNHCLFVIYPLFVLSFPRMLFTICYGTYTGWVLQSCVAELSRLDVISYIVLMGRDLTCYLLWAPYSLSSHSNSG